MDKGYFPPFHLLRDGLEIDEDGQTVKMSTEIFRLLIQNAAIAVGFDPLWYRNENPDVAEAIAEGALDTELDHFALAGYFEGRTPAYFAVDEDWYFTQNPDVTEAIASGAVEDVDAHYNDVGYLEGRSCTEEQDAWLQAWNHAISESAELLHAAREKTGGA